MVITMKECERRSKGNSGNPGEDIDLAWIKPPIWAEIIILSVDLLLATSLAHYSKYKKSRAKWILFLALTLSLVIQILIGDLGRLINLLSYNGVRSVHQFAIFLAMPIVRAILTAITLGEEYLTVKYAHTLFGQSSGNESNDNGGTRRKLTCFALLGVLISLFFIGLSLMSCRTSRFYMSPSGRTRGTSGGYWGNEQPAVTIFAAVLLAMTLLLDLYQEIHRIRHGAWKLGSATTMRVNLRVSTYATAGWTALVVWVCVTGLPGYYPLMYTGVVTTLALPALGVVTEIYKIGKYGMGRETFLD